MLRTAAILGIALLLAVIASACATTGPSTSPHAGPPDGRALYERTISLPDAQAYIDKN